VHFHFNILIMNECLDEFPYEFAGRLLLNNDVVSCGKRLCLCYVNSTMKNSKWDTTRSLRYNQDSQREEGLPIHLSVVCCWFIYLFIYLFLLAQKQ